MKIIISENAGFCYGVKRADEMLDALLKKNKKVCTLGPLAHNADYIKSLEQRGVYSINSPDELPEGCELLIRSHGVARSVYESLEKRNVVFHDATCPSVKRIQDLIKKQPPESVTLLAGDKNHPEIIGILGHASCGSVVFESAGELEKAFENTPDLAKKISLCLSQTTFSAAEWEKCKKVIKKHCTKAGIFDTICKTNCLRQIEAKKLASVCDLVIVIGGPDSSNTKKLVKICSESAKTLWVQNSAELEGFDFSSCRTVGITAGASTPVNNIMEVVHKMDENKDILSDNGEEFDYEEALEESFKRLSKSDTIKGVVTAVYPGEVAVDIGRKHAGYIPLSELTNDPNAKTEDLVKVGDELTLMVLKTNDADGTVMMSKRRIDADQGWKKIVAAKESGEILSGVVRENVGGGVIVYTDGARVFIPASHTGIPKEGDLNTLLKTTVNYIIIEVEEGRRKRAIGSIRKAASSGRKEMAVKFWETAQAGDAVKGVVRSISPFGVFVNIGGVDGLVHKTELSYRRFKNIEDIVTVGQELDVFIKELDPEKKRVSLSCRFEKDDPFVKFAETASVGDTVSVTVTSVVAYGAFAEIVPGVEGLIHISNLSDKRIAKAADAVSKGQTVDAKIIEINKETKKVGLSIKALMNDEESVSDCEEEAADTESKE